MSTFQSSNLVSLLTEMAVNEDLNLLFEEPADFSAKDATPTFINYERTNPPSDEPSEVTLRLVAKSPLWGHLLWNAGRVSAEWVETHRAQLQYQTVLELGAAAAIPSLLAALVAKNVVITDYPDPNLIDNIEHNMQLLRSQCPTKDLKMSVQGYIWGHDPQPLFDAPNQNGEKFDVVIMSDLIFNHSEHEKLIKTAKLTLKPQGRALVVFSPHRPRLYQRDLAFFDLAKENGFDVEQIVEQRMSPMFEEDEETKELRSMVFGYILRFA